MAITNEQLTYSIEVKNNDMNAKLSASIAKAEMLNDSMEGLHGTVRKTSKIEEEYQKALQKSAETMAQNDEYIGRISQSTENLNRSFEQTTSIIENLSQAITGASIAVAGLKKAYEIISDPRVIKAAQDILTIFEAMAVVKGFERLASSIEISRKKLETLAEAMDKFRNMVSADIFENISKAAEKANMFLIVTDGLGIATKAIAVTLAVIAGFSVWGTIAREGFELTKIMGGLKETFVGLFRFAVDGFSKLTKNANLSKIGVAELHDAFTILGAGGSVLGAINLLTGGLESITAASFKASAASLAFGLALKGAVIFIGDFIQSVGERLAGAMDVAVEKFAKTQQILSQFGFVVKNFGAAYGEGFIGTIGQWEGQIERLANTTTFSANEIRKSAKLVIAENKALGLSYEENVKFLDRSVEIAASSGLDLFEVVQRLQSALVGNATAVAALGINLGAHALEHSDLNKTIQKTIGTMTEQEKKQIALYEIYKQTEPLVGSSIKQGETIIGINQQLANSYEQIQSKLGSVNVFLMALNSSYADLVKTVSNLPQIFFDLVGGVGDFAAVALQVIGFTFKWILVITTLVTAYKVLNVVIATNMIVQTKLNAVAAMLGLTFRFQAASVTTASAALALLGKTLKGSLIFIFTNVQAAAIGATKAIGAMTIAILTNPLFLKTMVIAATIMFVVKAFAELNQEMNIVDDQMASFQESFVKIKSVFTATGKAMVTAFGGVVQIIKILLISLGYLWQAAKIGYNALKKLWDPTNAAKYQSNIEATLNILDTMANSHTKAIDKLAGLWDSAVGGSTAYAQSVDRAAKQFDELVFRQLQLTRTAAEIDTNTMRINTLGTEVEKLTNKYTNASKEVEKFSNEVLNASEVSAESLKDYKRAVEEQAQAGLDIEKLRIDKLKEVATITKDVQKEVLRLAGNETVEINAEFDDRRKAVAELEAQISRLGPVSGKSAKQIIEAYSAIEKGRNAALQDAQAKKDKEANDEYLKFLKDQNDLLGDIAKRNRELQIDALGDTVTDRQKINEILRSDTEELEKQIKHYRVQWGSQSAIVQGLEKQKGLLKEAADTQREMADMKFMDWIDSLGDSINRVFGKKTIDDFFGYIKSKASELSANPIVMKVQQVASNVSSSVASSPVGEAIGTGVGNAVQVAKDAGNILYQSAGAIASALSQAGGWVGAVIDVFMNADKYLKVLIEFPKSFLKILKNLPALAQQVIDTLPGMIRAIAEALPGIIIQLVDMIPDFIAALTDAMPTLFERIAEIIPEVFVKLVAMIPKLIEMLVKNMAKIIQGIIKGLIRGIGNLLKGIKMPKLKVETKAIEKVGQKLADSASRIFQVKDLTEAAKDPLDKLSNTLTTAGQKARDYIIEAGKWLDEKLWQPLGRIVQEAWQFVKQLWEGLKTVVAGAWQFVVRLWEMLKDVVAGAWQFVANLWGNLKSAVSDAWQFVKELWDGLSGVVSGAFQWVLDKVWAPLSELGQKIGEGFLDAIKGIGNFFSGIWEGFKNLFKFDFSGIGEAISGAFDSAMSSLRNVFRGIMDPLIDMINGVINLLNKAVLPSLSISVPKWAGGGKWNIWNEIDIIPGDISTIAKFASGGLVPQGGINLSGFGTDTVPAMLTPGEFIVSRPAVNTVGLDNLRQINRGQMPSGGTYNLSFEINIDAKTNLDESYIRGTLVPRMQDELKRASLDGKFVLSAKGIR